MYALFFAGSYALAYFGMYAFFPMILGQRLYKPTKLSAFAIVLILILISATIIITMGRHNEFWPNRFEHAFGGGVIMMLAAYLAQKDSRTRMTRFQFFALSALLVTALGVANEILELYVYFAFGYNFANSVLDTGFDLLSNTVGILLASLVLVPLYKPRA